MTELRIDYRLKTEELLRIKNLYNEHKLNYSDLND